MSEFSLEQQIEDMLDAICEGELHDGNIKDNEGNVIKTAGHGSNYYKNNRPYIFMELIANYGAIIKSPRREELTEELINIFGYEFVNMLQEFYDKLYLEEKDKIVTRS